MCDKSGEISPFTPSVARWVHYWHHGSADGKYQPKCSAALVTGVDAETGTVSVTVFTDGGGIHPHAALERDESPAAERRGGTWHVPAYVPAPARA